MNLKNDNIVVKCETKEAFNVFKSVYGEMDESRFINKHENNPSKLSTSIYGEVIEEQVVGINAFMGCELSCDNKIYKAAQSCDTAVLKECRGKGIFTHIVLNAEKKLKYEMVQILFGFPNDMSYGGFKKMGWCDGGDLYDVVLRCDFMWSRGKINKIYQIIDCIINFFCERNIHEVEGYDIEIHDEFPFSFEELRIINAGEETFIKRTEQYYKWRIDNNGEYKYIKILKNDTLSGYAIYRLMNDGVKQLVEIVDWFVNDNETGALTTLFYYIRKEAKGYLYIPFVANDSAEEMLLRNLGFRKLVGNRHRVVYKFLDKNVENSSELQKWRVRLIDVDTIMN